MSANKQKILIVDDEPDILELIEYNLKKKVTKFLLQLTVRMRLPKRENQSRFDHFRCNDA